MRKKNLFLGSVSKGETEVLRFGKTEWRTHFLQAVIEGKIFHFTFVEAYEEGKKSADAFSGLAIVNHKAERKIKSLARYIVSQPNIVEITFKYYA